MFDQVVQVIEAYPYIGVAMVFLLCGLGFPLPEELVLLSAGYISAKFPDKASLPPMMAWCAGAILIGDLVPFLLGRIFGVRLLRLRWLRYFVTKQRLAMFDKWFRRRGDLVIVISRFLAGLRVVAFFTAGAMKMRWLRFLFLDGLGIALMVPLLILVGFHSAAFIEEAITTVQRVERGLLWGVGGAVALAGLWLWLWRQRRQRARRQQLQETFVQPQRPVQAAAAGEPGAGEPTAGNAPPTAAAKGASKGASNGASKRQPDAAANPAENPPATPPAD